MIFLAPVSIKIYFNLFNFQSGGPITKDII